MKSIESNKELVAAANGQGCPMDFTEAQIILEYMKGHDYQLAEDDSGVLYRRDLAPDDSDQDSYQPYTIRDALDFCIDMSDELLDLEREKADPDTGYITRLEEDASIFLRLQERYEAVDFYFEFLDALRESGVTNMFGAVPYLTEKFPELSENQARAILSTWMKRKGALHHES